MALTKEQMKLLLDDLCARLSYSVKGTVKTTDGNGQEITDDGIINSAFIDEHGKAYICVESAEYELEDVKPYLRPMSSMTVEEEAQIQKFIDIVTNENYGDGYSPSAWDAMNGFVQYCDSRHLDHRGLIFRGLALEAPDGMYTVLCRNVSTKTDIRAKTPFFDKNGVRIYDGDVFVYLKYTNFKDGVPSDLIENYSKYENEVVLHPVFWDDNKKLWCSDVYGDCDNLASYDFNEVVVVTNKDEHPELYNY